MDLSQFKASTGSSINQSKNIKAKNPIAKKVAEFKNWVYPSVTTQRQLRIQQYRDFAIFAGAIITVAYFEDQIKNYL